VLWCQSCFHVQVGVEQVSMPAALRPVSLDQHPGRA